MTDGVTETDFIALLRQHGQLPQQQVGENETGIEPTEGTTILAVRYRDGVLGAFTIAPTRCCQSTTAR